MKYFEMKIIFPRKIVKENKLTCFYFLGNCRFIWSYRKQCKKHPISPFSVYIDDTLFFKIFIFCFACMYVCEPCVSVTQGQKKINRSFGTGVRDVSELPCGCWELNPGPVQEQVLDC